MPRTTNTNRVSRHRIDAGERGSVTLELALIFPMVMLLVFGMVQAGIYFHARNIALAAAQEGARAASVENGSAGAGEAAAAQFATRVGGGMITDINAAAARGTTATVVVTCRTFSLVPGTESLQVRQSASLPVERITR